MNAKFSPERVRMGLSAYIEGEPTKYWYHRSQSCYVRRRYELVYGINTYRILYNYVNTAREEGKWMENWKQVFHLWLEHKKKMYARLKYMGENGHLRNAQKYLNTYNVMISYADIALKLCIMFYITRKKEIITKIFEYVKWVEEMERLEIPNIINSIVIENPLCSRGIVWDYAD